MCETARKGEWDSEAITQTHTHTPSQRITSRHPGRSEDDLLSVIPAGGHFLAPRNMTWSHQAAGPAGWVICLHRGVGETVPFFRRARDDRREWNRRGCCDRVQVEAHEAGWNPRFGGRALSPSPLRFPDDDEVRAIGGLELLLDARPTLLQLVDRLWRRQAVRLGSVAGGGGGRRRGGRGGRGRALGRSGGVRRRRAGGFCPLFPAATCVTIEVGRHAKAPAADLTCPGFARVITDYAFTAGRR